MGELYNRLRKLSHTNPPNLPALQAEKTFHIFFWYDHNSESDCETIDDIKRKLDDTYPNEIIYFDKDQFLPGQSILRNYIAGIKNSFKIAILVSKSFVSNGMKEYIMELALYNRRPKYAVIPLLKDVELPDILKPLTEKSVEVNSKTDKWWEHFLESITKEIEISGLIKHIPHLSAEKSYHFSLLYDTRDQEKIDEMLQGMKGILKGKVFKYELIEIPENKYTGVFLINGIEDILTKVEKSMKFVVYLSKNISCNENCKYLTKLVKMLMQDIRLPGGYIIPVCEVETPVKGHVGWFEDLFDTEIQCLYTTQEEWIERLIDSLARTEKFEQTEPQYFTFPGNTQPPCPCNVPKLFELPKKSKHSCCQAKVFRVSEFSCNGSEKKEPRLLDVCFRNDRDIIVIDAGNSKLKRYSFSGCEINKLDLDGMPNRMSYIRDGLVAIIYEYGFGVICIDTDSMVFTKIIISPYECLRGIIAINEDTFAITIGDGQMEFCLLELSEEGSFIQKVVDADSHWSKKMKLTVQENSRSILKREREIYSNPIYQNAEILKVRRLKPIKAKKVTFQQKENGTVLQTSETLPDRRLINMPRRLAYSHRRGQVVIADENDRQLIYFNKDAYEMATREKWKGLYNMRGLATDGDRIYVAASNSILVYNFEGNKISDKTDPLIEMTHIVYHTRGVAVDRSGSYIAVTQATKHKGKKCEIVRVFKV